MTTVEIGRTLKKLRLDAGFTQKQAYEYVGVAQSTFSSWEIGKAEPPVGMLLKLCQLYKVPDIFAAFGYDGYNEDGSIQLNLKEQNLIEKYRSLDQPGREHVDTVIQWESDRAEQIASVSSQIAVLEGRGGSRAYSDAELRALSIDEKVELYRQELEREEKVVEESEAS